jgi:hypothetical protein
MHAMIKKEVIANMEQMPPVTDLWSALLPKCNLSEGFGEKMSIHFEH